MNKKWLIAIVPGVLSIVFAVLVIVLLIVKLLWSGTIPDLFPGAVEQGLVAAQISWLTSLKIAIFVAVLADQSISSLTWRRGDLKDLDSQKLKTYRVIFNQQDFNTTECNLEHFKSGSCGPNSRYA